MSDAVKVRIWDLPVRLFHWAIVLLLPALWATHHYHLLDWHILLGEIMLGLILFRLLWGVLGSSTARFTGFVKGPGKVWHYLTGRGTPSFGHNPLGGWSVLLMLLLLLTQVGLGLFVTDEDALYEGPLAHLVTYDTSRILADRHETIFWIIVAIVALHVLAVLYYWLVKHDNLVAPMVTGKRGADEGETAAMVPAPLWRFVLSAVLAAGATLAILRLL